MIRTDTDKEEEAKALGVRVKREVNKRYKLLEIEQDAMYKCMLLLKKKKYAAIKLEHDAAGRTIEVCGDFSLAAHSHDFSFLLLQPLSVQGKLTRGTSCMSISSTSCQIPSRIASARAVTSESASLPCHINLCCAFSCEGREKH